MKEGNESVTESKAGFDLYLPFDSRLNVVMGNKAIDPVAGEFRA